MTTLYIDRKNTQLHIESSALVISINHIRQSTLPLVMLERIVISVSTQLASSVLLKLAEQAIVVSFINPRKTSQQASLFGAFPKNAKFRLMQYQLQSDPEASLSIATQLVQAKIINHLRFYKRVEKHRSDLHFVVIKTQKQLKTAWQSCNATTLTIERLRGIEGSAARASFKAYTHLFASQLGFTGRNRRPPKDPVNACLSLAFTLLHHRAAQQAYARGLDPMIGYLHEVYYSRDSLASDLIEVWRPYIEEWVWEIFRTRYLREDDFSNTDKGCLLNKSGRQKFYAAFEKRMKPITRAIRWQLMRFINTHLRHSTQRDTDHAPLIP